MSVKSPCASGERVTDFLGGDIGVGALTSVESISGVPAHLSHQFGGEGSTVTAVELIDAGLQLSPQLLQLSLLLIQQAHRGANHFASVEEVAAFDPLADPVLDVSGKLNRQDVSPSLYPNIHGSGVEMAPSIDEEASTTAWTQRPKGMKP